MDDAIRSQNSGSKAVPFAGLLLAISGGTALLLEWLHADISRTVLITVAGTSTLLGAALFWLAWTGRLGGPGGGPGDTRRRFEAVLSAMHDAIIETDWQGIREVNDSFCRMTGFSREELIGARAPFPFWPQEEYARIAEALETSMRGQARDFELVLNRKSGERFPVLLCVSRILQGKKGAKNRVLYSFRDISDLKAAEEKVRDGERRYRTLFEAADADHRAKEELLTLLKRELRTPMTPILGLASSLKKDPRLPADMQEEMAIIQRNAEDAKALIDDVLKRAGHTKPAADKVNGNPPIPRKDPVRILLVEDHLDSARVVTRILEQRGFAVTGVSTVAQARQAMAGDATLAFHIAICDLALPDGTGYEVIAALRDAKTGPVPTIAFSSWGSPQDLEKTRQAGFAEHLHKPVNAEELLAVVERLAAR